MSSDSGTDDRGPPKLCGVCQAALGAEEQHITAVCNNASCGESCYHVDCVTPYMAKVHHDSTRAMERSRRLITSKPAYYMQTVHMDCPRQPPGCGGKISTADMVKPIKAPPPPPPGLARPARQRGRKKAGAPAAAAGVPPPPARRQVAPQAPPPPSRKQLQQQARATAAAMRASVAPNYDVLGAGGDAQPSPGSGAGGSGLRFSSKLKFPPGQRPLELQMCAEYEELGECYHYRCPRCHGEEELQKREAAWQARQQAEKRQKRQEELQRFEKIKEQQAEQAVWVAQVRARQQEQLEHEEGYLQMGDATLKLMKDHKRSLCVTSLMDMAFDPDLAMAAAESTGCDLSAAAAALMEGTLGSGTKPVSVTGEAQELLACATSMGFGLQEVEIALVLASGDWEAAKRQLSAQAEQAAVSASAAEAGVASQATAALSSREQAELAAALRASASTAQPVPSAAAMAAAAREEAELAAALRASLASAGTYAGSSSSVDRAAVAREEAELAAAIEASRAEAARQEQQRQGWQQAGHAQQAQQAQRSVYSLPWAMPAAGASSAGGAAGGWPITGGGLDWGPPAPAAMPQAQAAAASWQTSSSSSSAALHSSRESSGPAAASIAPFPAGPSNSSSSLDTAGAAPSLLLPVAPDPATQALPQPGKLLTGSIGAGLPRIDSASSLGGGLAATAAAQVPPAIAASWSTAAPAAPAVPAAAFGAASNGATSSTLAGGLAGTAPTAAPAADLDLAAAVAAAQPAQGASGNWAQPSLAAAVAQDAEVEVLMAMMMIGS